MSVTIITTMRIVILKTITIIAMIIKAIRVIIATIILITLVSIPPVLREFGPSQSHKDLSLGVRTGQHPPKSLENAAIMSILHDSVSSLEALLLFRGWAAQGFILF